MATEADSAESPLITKKERENKDLASMQSSNIGLAKKEDGEVNQPPEVVTDMSKIENIGAAADFGTKLITDSQGNVATSKGDSFLELPGVSRIASPESCNISEHFQDKGQKVEAVIRTGKENEENKERTEERETNLAETQAQNEEGQGPAAELRAGSFNKDIGTVREVANKEESNGTLSTKTPQIQEELAETSSGREEPEEADCYSMNDHESLEEMGQSEKQEDAKGGTEEIQYESIEDIFTEALERPAFENEKDSTLVEAGLQKFGVTEGEKLKQTSNDQEELKSNEKMEDVIQVEEDDIHNEKYAAIANINISSTQPIEVGKHKQQDISKHEEGTDGGFLEKDGSEIMSERPFNIISEEIQKSYSSESTQGNAHANEEVGPIHKKQEISKHEKDPDGGILEQNTKEIKPERPLHVVYEEIQEAASSEHTQETTSLNEEVVSPTVNKQKISKHEKCQVGGFLEQDRPGMNSERPLNVVSEETQATGSSEQAQEIKHLEEEKVGSIDNRQGNSKHEERTDEGFLEQDGQGPKFERSLNITSEGIQEAASSEQIQERKKVNEDGVEPIENEQEISKLEEGQEEGILKQDGTDNSEIPLNAVSEEIKKTALCEHTQDITRIDEEEMGPIENKQGLSEHENGSDGGFWEQDGPEIKSERSLHVISEEIQESASGEPSQEITNTNAEGVRPIEKEREFSKREEGPDEDFLEHNGAEKKSEGVISEEIQKDASSEHGQELMHVDEEMSPIENKHEFSKHEEGPDGRILEKDGPGQKSERSLNVTSKKISKTDSSEERKNLDEEVVDVGSIENEQEISKHEEGTEKAILKQDGPVMKSEISLNVVSEEIQKTASSEHTQDITRVDEEEAGPTTNKQGVSEHENGTKGGILEQDEPAGRTLYIISEEVQKVDSNVQTQEMTKVYEKGVGPIENDREISKHVEEPEQGLLEEDVPEIMSERQFNVISASSEHTQETTNVNEKVGSIENIEEKESGKVERPINAADSCNATPNPPPVEIPEKNTNRMHLSLIEETSKRQGKAEGKYSEEPSDLYISSDVEHISTEGFLTEEMTSVTNQALDEKLKQVYQLETEQVLEVRDARERKEKMQIKDEDADSNIYEISTKIYEGNIPDAVIGKGTRDQDGGISPESSKEDMATDLHTNEKQSIKLIGKGFEESETVINDETNQNHCSNASVMNQNDHSYERTSTMEKKKGDERDVIDLKVELKDSSTEFIQENVATCFAIESKTDTLNERTESSEDLDTTDTLKGLEESMSPNKGIGNLVENFSLVSEAPDTKIKAAAIEKNEISSRTTESGTVETILNNIDIEEKKQINSLSPAYDEMDHTKTIRNTVEGADIKEKLEETSNFKQSSMVKNPTAEKQVANEGEEHGCKMPDDTVGIASQINVHGKYNNSEMPVDDILDEQRNPSDVSRLDSLDFGRQSENEELRVEGEGTYNPPGQNIGNNTTHESKAKHPLEGSIMEGDAVGKGENQSVMGITYKYEASDAKSIGTLPEEVERASALMDKDIYKEALPQTNKIGIKEDINDIKNLSAGSDEGQSVGKMVQDCESQREQAPEPKQNTEWHIDSPQNANEEIKDILTEKVHGGTEKASQSESIKEQIIQEDHIVSKVQDDVVPIENLKITDFSEKMETVTSELADNPTWILESSPSTQDLEGKWIQKEGSEKPISVSIFAYEVSESNIKEMITKELQPDEKPFNALSISSGKTALGEKELIDSTPQEEDFDREKLEQTSDLFTQVPIIVDNESVTLEITDAKKTKEMKGLSDQVFDSKDDHTLQVDQNEQTMPVLETTTEEAREVSEKITRTMHQEFELEAISEDGITRQDHLPESSSTTLSTETYNVIEDKRYSLNDNTKEQRKIAEGISRFEFPSESENTTELPIQIITHPVFECFLQNKVGDKCEEPSNLEWDSKEKDSHYVPVESPKVAGKLEEEKIKEKPLETAQTELRTEETYLEKAAHSNETVVEEDVVPPKCLQSISLGEETSKDIQREEIAAEGNLGKRKSDEIKMSNNEIQTEELSEDIESIKDIQKQIRDGDAPVKDPCVVIPRGDAVTEDLSEKYDVLNKSEAAIRLDLQTKDSATDDNTAEGATSHAEVNRVMRETDKKPTGAIIEKESVSIGGEKEPDTKSSIPPMASAAPEETLHGNSIDKDIPLQSENTHTEEKTVHTKKINSESVEVQIFGQMIPKGERKRHQPPEFAIKNRDKIEKPQNTTADAEELLIEEVPKGVEKTVESEQIKDQILLEDDIVSKVKDSDVVPIESIKKMGCDENTGMVTSEPEDSPNMEPESSLTTKDLEKKRIQHECSEKPVNIAIFELEVSGTHITENRTKELHPGEKIVKTTSLSSEEKSLGNTGIIENTPEGKDNEVFEARDNLIVQADNNKQTMAMENTETEIAEDEKVSETLCGSKHQGVEFDEIIASAHTDKYLSAEKLQEKVQELSSVLLTVEQKHETMEDENLGASTSTKTTKDILFPVKEYGNPKVPTETSDVIEDIKDNNPNDKTQGRNETVDGVLLFESECIAELPVPTNQTASEDILPKEAGEKFEEPINLECEKKEKDSQYVPEVENAEVLGKLEEVEIKEESTKTALLKSSAEVNHLKEGANTNDIIKKKKFNEEIAENSQPVFLGDESSRGRQQRKLTGEDSLEENINEELATIKNEIQAKEISEDIECTDTREKIQDQTIDRDMPAKDPSAAITRSNTVVESLLEKSDGINVTEATNGLDLHDKGAACEGTTTKTSRSCEVNNVRQAKQELCTAGINGKEFVNLSDEKEPNITPGIQPNTGAGAKALLQASLTDKANKAGIENSFHEAKCLDPESFEGKSIWKAVQEGKRRPDQALEPKQGYKQVTPYDIEKVPEEVEQTVERIKEQIIQEEQIVSKVKQSDVAPDESPKAVESGEKTEAVTPELSNNPNRVLESLVITQELDRKWIQQETSEKPVGASTFTPTISEANIEEGITKEELHPEEKPMYAIGISSEEKAPQNTHMIRSTPEAEIDSVRLEETSDLKTQLPQPDNMHKDSVKMEYQNANEAAVTTRLAYQVDEIEQTSEMEKTKTELVEEERKEISETPYGPTPQGVELDGITESASTEKYVSTEKLQEKLPESSFPLPPTEQEQKFIMAINDDEKENETVEDENLEDSFSKRTTEEASFLNKDPESYNAPTETSDMIGDIKGSPNDKPKRQRVIIDGVPIFESASESDNIIELPLSTTQPKLEKKLPTEGAKNCEETPNLGMDKTMEEPNYVLEVEIPEVPPKLEEEKPKEEPLKIEPTEQGAETQLLEIIGSNEIIKNNISNVEIIEELVEAKDSNYVPKVKIPEVLIESEEKKIKEEPSKTEVTELRGKENQFDIEEVVEAKDTNYVPEVEILKEPSKLEEEKLQEETPKIEFTELRTGEDLLEKIVDSNKIIQNNVSNVEAIKEWVEEDTKYVLEVEMPEVPSKSEEEKLKEELPKKELAKLRAEEYQFNSNEIIKNNIPNVEVVEALVEAKDFNYVPEIKIAEVMIKLEEEKLKGEPPNTELVELGGHNNQLEKAMTKNSISNVEIIEKLVEAKDSNYVPEVNICKVLTKSDEEKLNEEPPKIEVTGLRTEENQFEVEEVAEAKGSNYGSGSEIPKTITKLEDDKLQEEHPETEFTELRAKKDQLEEAVDLNDAIKKEVFNVESSKGQIEEKDSRYELEVETTEVPLRSEEEKLKEEPSKTELAKLRANENQFEGAFHSNEIIKNNITNVEVVDELLKAKDSNYVPEIEIPEVIAKLEEKLKDEPPNIELIELRADENRLEKATNSTTRNSIFNLEIIEELMEVKDPNYVPRVKILEVLTKSKEEKIKEEPPETEITEQRAEENQLEEAIGSNEISENNISNEEIVEELEEEKDSQPVSIDEESFNETERELTKDHPGKKTHETFKTSHTRDKIQTIELSEDIEIPDASNKIQNQIIDEDKLVSDPHTVALGLELQNQDGASGDVTAKSTTAFEEAKQEIPTTDEKDSAPISGEKDLDTNTGIPAPPCAAAEETLDGNIIDKIKEPSDTDSENLVKKTVKIHTKNKEIDVPVNDETKIPIGDEQQYKHGDSATERIAATEDSKQNIQDRPDKGSNITITENHKQHGWVSHKKTTDEGSPPIELKASQKEDEDEKEKPDDITQKQDPRIHIVQERDIAGLGEEKEKQLDNKSHATLRKQIPIEMDPRESTKTRTAVAIPNVPQVLREAEVEGLEQGTAFGIKCGGEKKIAYTHGEMSEPASTEIPGVQNHTEKSLTPAGEIASELKSGKEMCIAGGDTIRVGELKTDGEKHEAEGGEGEEIEAELDAPLMVEASSDTPTHKKSHSIFSGVGSKVKHSIAMVKKAIACHPRPIPALP